MLLNRGRKDGGLLRKTARSKTARPRKRRLSQKIVFQRLAEAYEQVLTDAFGMTIAETRDIFKALANPSARGTRNDAKDVAAVIRNAFENSGRRALEKEAASIRTEDQLTRRIEEMRRESY